MSEPWVTALYLFIAVAILMMREQRRVASLRRLRNDQEGAALTRQAHLSTLLLDRVGSPLQTLHLSIDLLRDRGVATSDIEEIRQAFAQLNAACKLVPELDARARQYIPASFDWAPDLFK
jgi:hypothetical protein